MFKVRCSLNFLDPLLFLLMQNWISYSKYFVGIVLRQFIPLFFENLLSSLAFLHFLSYQISKTKVELESIGPTSQMSYKNICFVFTHITFVIKPVHILMARSRVFKNRLKVGLCYVHFACVPTHVSGISFRPFIYIYIYITYIYIYIIYIYIYIYIIYSEKKI